MRGWQARSPPRRRGGGCHREAPAYAGCAARSGAGGGEWAGPLPHPNSKVVSSNTVVLLAATKTAKKVALALTAGIWQASPHVVGDLANGDALYEGRCCCSHDSSNRSTNSFRRGVASVNARDAGAGPGCGWARGLQLVEFAPRLARPLLDLVGVPNVAGGEHRRGLREVGSCGQLCHALAGDAEHGG